jgi:DnaJ-class molecular chaperone
VTRHPRPWVVEAADGPCPTCRGSGFHPTALNTRCPACKGVGLTFNPIQDPATIGAAIRYANESAAQMAASNWFGGQRVLYRVVKLDPCPDHHGAECPNCHGAGEVRHRPAEVPIFGDLLPSEFS